VSAAAYSWAKCTLIRNFAASLRSQCSLFAYSWAKRTQIRNFTATDGDGRPRFGRGDPLRPGGRLAPPCQSVVSYSPRIITMRSIDGLQAAAHARYQTGSGNCIFSGGVSTFSVPFPRRRERCLAFAQVGGGGNVAPRKRRARKTTHTPEKVAYSGPRLVSGGRRRPCASPGPAWRDATVRRGIRSWAILLRPGEFDHPESNQNDHGSRGIVTNASPARDLGMLQTEQRRFVAD
jgi:hypothetical protein